MSNFNLTYQKDGENEQLYYKDAHNNDLYIRSCEDFAPAIIQEKSGNPIVITDGADCPIRKLKIIFEPIQDGSGDPSPDNIRPISGRDCVTVTRTGVNDYHPGNVQSATIQLGQTVYGGTVDVTSGEMVVDRAMVDLGTLNWNVYDSSTNTFTTNDFTNKKSATSGAISSQYSLTNRLFAAMPDMTMRGSTNNLAIWIIRDSRYSDAATFKTAMSGVQLVYELNTPQTIQLTPAQLSTLKGENTFSTDGTSIELEYVVDTKTYIDNLFNSGTKTVVKTNDEIKIIDENKGVE